MVNFLLHNTSNRVDLVNFSCVHFFLISIESYFVIVLQPCLDFITVHQIINESTLFCIFTIIIGKP